MLASGYKKRRMKINPKKQISKKYKTSIGYLEGTISIILNTLLFGLKYWVGIKTFSIAIIADAWHTLSDSLTSLVGDYRFQSLVQTC